MRQETSPRHSTNIEGTQSCLTFKAISGFTVTRESMIDEIRRLPLDGILGFLAGISLEIMQSESDYQSSSLQGGYLNCALVDDFPHTIQSAYKRYIPGRAPITGRHHVFVHEQNIAWLSHAAILYAKQDVITSEITYNLSCRLFRLLLIINDLLNVDRMAGPFSLEQRQKLVQDWLRDGQFNRFFGDKRETLAKLARQKIIMCDILPMYLPDVRSLFANAAGIGLLRYFEVLSVMIAHFQEGMRKGTHWLARDTIMSNIKANRADMEFALNNWAVSPEAYRSDCQTWRCQRKDQGELALYDYVPLRKKPLVEARHGELICAVPSFLFAKIEDEPYFLLSEFLTGSDRQKFHTALGYAYHEYANCLVERIACNDKAGKWSVKRNPQTKQHEELADIYLQRNGLGIAFEHKGQRPGTEFLRGGEGDLVVGPSVNLIGCLEAGDSITFSKGKSEDNGLITRGMWQQSKAGQNLLLWAEEHFGKKPVRLFPVITLYSSLVVDTAVRKIYLMPLIEMAKLYKEEFWVKPQWINVRDLESLAAMAEAGKLDFEELLHEKTTEYDDRRFDVFLYSHQKFRHIDPRLSDEADSILKSAAITFFGET